VKRMEATQAKAVREVRLFYSPNSFIIPATISLTPDARITAASAASRQHNRIFQVFSIPIGFLRIAPINEGDSNEGEQEPLTILFGKWNGREQIFPATRAPDARLPQISESARRATLDHFGRQRET